VAEDASEKEALIPYMDDHALRQALAEHLRQAVTLRDEEMDHALSFFKPRRARKRQYLVQAGDPVPHEFFVVKGCTKAFHVDTEGREHILQFGIEDWWITDWQAYFARTEARLHVDCLEDCALLLLHLDDRERLCRELHPMEHFFRVKLTNGYMALQRRILHGLVGDAEERYRQFVKEQPALAQRVPKQQLAAYLGLSRETLSRIRL
jgi:CRP-like cAMP-binding protein